MGETTIEWTDATWNPATGCTKVSQGCKNCYAERVFPRAYGKTGRRFIDVATHPDRLEQPLRWRKPRRVFVNSMSDLFHEGVPEQFIDKVFAAMAFGQRHTFQILTKRPQRMLDYMATGDRRELVACRGTDLGAVMHALDEIEWPLDNVWLGVSVEDQETADERIPLLLQTPAAVRFVSYEPALAEVDFMRLATPCGPINCLHGTRGNDCTTEPWQKLDWIIVGGESGPGARPFDVAWARETIRQCRAAGVACFVKQLGRHPTTDHRTRPAGEPSYWTSVLRDRKGGDMAEWPADLRVREFPDAAQARKSKL